MAVLLQIYLRPKSGLWQLLREATVSECGKAITRRTHGYQMPKSQGV